MKSIFIIGVSSNLGSFLSKKLSSKKYEIHGSYNNNKIVNKSYVKLNEQSSDEYIKDVLKIRPSFVIHCAALTNIEECEKNLDKTINVNSKFPTKVAKICKELGIKFIFISTDQIFDGTQKKYSENVPPKPLNNYAISKVEAEKNILKINNESLILRLSFIGKSLINQKNFFDFVHDSLKNKKEIKGFDDIFFTPISLDYLNEILIEIFKKNLSGIFNIGSNKSISKYELSKEIAKRYNLDESLIIKSKYYSDKTTKVTRPKNMSLNITKICNALKISGKSIIQMNW